MIFEAVKSLCHTREARLVGRDCSQKVSLCFEEVTNAPDI